MTNEEQKKAPDSLDEEIQEDMKDIKSNSLDENITKLKSDLADLTSKNLSLSKKVSEKEDSLLRAYAEMDNVRRRTQKDIQNAHKYSLENFSKELIPVIDSLEKANDFLKHGDKKKPEKYFSSVESGINLTLKVFISSLNKFSIKQINPKNELFDPNKHEAIATRASSEFENNKVIEVCQIGYELNDRIIRPARVIVSKNT